MRPGSKTAALANSGAKTSLPQDLWQSRRSPPHDVRSCTVPVLQALSSLLRRRPAHKGIPWAVPSLLRTFTSPGEGAGPGSRPAPAWPVSSYRPGLPACVSGPDRPGTGSGGMSCAAGMGHSEPQRGTQAASCENALWSKRDSGPECIRAAPARERHNKRIGTAGRTAQQAGRLSRLPPSDPAPALQALTIAVPTIQGGVPSAGRLFWSRSRTGFPFRLLSLQAAP